jgi:hypothetical protein
VRESFEKRAKDRGKRKSEREKKKEGK